MHFPAHFRRLIRVVLLLTASLLLLATPHLQAQSNTVDPVFGGAGLGLLGQVDGLFLQSDGKLLVVGGINGLARLNTDGTTDYSFQASITPADAVLVLTVQTNGQILIGTSSDEDVNGVAVSSGLMRLNADGSTDTSFNASTVLVGSGGYASAYAAATQTNGMVLVAPYGSVPSVIRLKADGSLDPTFVVNLSNATNDATVTNLVVQSDSTTLICGTFTQINNVARNGLAQLNGDGTVDSAFSPPLAEDSSNPPVPSALVLDAVQANGQLLVSGSFSEIGGFATNGLARLKVDGSVDTTFNYTGPALSQYSIAAVQPDGQIIIESYDEAGLGMTLSRLNANGSVDTSFNVTSDYMIRAVVAPADGTIIVGGEFTQINSFLCNSVARINTDGSVDTTYTPDVTSGPNATVTCLAVAPDGSILIGGTFTEIDGVAHNELARLKSDGTPDADFSASVVDTTVGRSGSAPQALAVQSDGKVLICGPFNQVNGTLVGGLARLNTDGSLDTSFNAVSGDPAAALAVQPDGKILVAGFFEIVESESPYSVYFVVVARLNTDGTLDPSFNATLGGEAASVAVQADGKILLAGNLNDDAENGYSLVRLNADGSLDPTFTSGLDDFGNIIACLAVQADGKILVGGYLNALGATFLYLARLNEDGSLDTGFDVALDNEVQTLLVEPDSTIVIGGLFTQVNGMPRNGLAHLNANGTVSDFLPSEVGTNGTVNTLVQQTDGKILIGGNFSSVEGVQRDFVARLTSGGTPDFFFGNVSVGNGFYYLQFPDGMPFGYYNLSGNGYVFPYFYHADLGMEYFFDANDGQGGAYMYDFASSTFFYTSPNFPWPYLYDFSLNTVLYYYPDPNNPGRYNTNGVRYFYDFASGNIITK